MINQRLSLVIPRVFPQWVDEAKIVKIFREQQIGIISKVSIVPMPMQDKKVQKYQIYKAYLYFSVWFDTIVAENFQKRIYGKNKQARVVYDDPWFWTIFENTERLKLSKNDKRLMRLSEEIYKISLFVNAQQEAQQEELACELEEQKQKLEEQKQKLEEQKQKLQEQKQKLQEQNNTMQILQDFCIQNGLDIPFWSAKHPPSAEISSFTTAVACADFVLQDNMPNKEFNYDFIPVKSYEADWVTENPYTNNTPEQLRLCLYLDKDFQLNNMTN